jgi:chemotaxis protein methyltransferase CheR
VISNGSSRPPPDSGDRSRAPGSPELRARISPRDFRLFRELIFKESGICLSDAKQILLVARLQGRLKALGISSFGAYYQHVTEGDDGELLRMLDCICTNETHFFREPQHFTLLEQRIFPEWEAKVLAGQMARRVRAWSAACSTGEEAYTLAMVLLDRFPPSRGYSVEVLATDLSTRALDVASAGIWPLAKSAEIPVPFLKRYMLRGSRSQAGKMKAGDEIRSVVRFQRMNLHDEQYSLSGQFELVFCRNVLIYFSPASRPRVIRQLLSHLSPAGYLFLGHAESATGALDSVRPIMPNAYAHRERK